MSVGVKAKEIIPKVTEKVEKYSFFFPVCPIDFY